MIDNLQLVPRLTLFLTSFVLLLQETVWTNIPAGQPLPSMGFSRLYGIYRLAINQLNFSKLGPYELVYNKLLTELMVSHDLPC